MKENNSPPFVSVIVPCLNEERFISKCLKSIIDSGWPKELMEVLVVDGRSKDRTRDIVKDYSDKYQFVKLLDNPRIITPAAMNIGIENSRGEIIIKMDAHSVYPEDYILKCVKYLKEWDADNVGGVLVTLPADESTVAKSIAISLSHMFGAGNSYFRIGSQLPREVDTVAFGCYKKSIFEKVGLFDERMAKIEDLELNFRLRKAGGRIMLFPDIKIHYYPSSKDLKDFFWHNFTDGIWTTFPLKFGVKIFSLRHLIPLIFVLVIIFSLILAPFFWQAWIIFNLFFSIYLIVNLFFSIKISLKEKDFKYLFLMPPAFIIRHFGYGLGSLWGLLKILTGK